MTDTDLGYKKSPAPFTPAVLDKMFDLLPPPPARVLDPFAGNGILFHEAAIDRGYDSVGVELEPEFAAAHLRNEVGDATRLRFHDDSFDAILTSVTYGNRMADHQDAQEQCRLCAGTGNVDDAPCSRCEGRGRNDYDRITYRHRLGRELSQGNTGGMAWGTRYRGVHKLAYIECRRVLAPRTIGDDPQVQFILNIKDHYRTVGQSGSVRQRVCNWHVQTLLDLGFVLVAAEAVKTPGMKKGQNGTLRVPWELVIGFELDPAVKDGRML